MAVIFRAHKEAILAIWGALLFMPGWAVKYLAGDIDFSTAKSMVDFATVVSLYFSQHWYILLPGNLVTTFGALAIYALLVRHDLPTIGAVMRFAIYAFPLYFAVQLTRNLSIMLGFYLLLIPGLYLMGRLAPLSPLYASGQRTGYVNLFKKCWALSRGAGWSIFFFLLIIMVISFIILLVAQLILGIAVQLLSGGTGLPLLAAALAAAVDALLYLALMLAITAIFRQLVQQETDIISPAV